MLHDKQAMFEPRREAKWQFRRALLLRVATMLEDQPKEIWPKITSNLELLMASPSGSIVKSARRWRRFAGNTPEQVSETIQRCFLTNTAEGPRRHKLQDLSDGHPFAGILSDQEIRQLRQKLLQDPEP